MRLRLKFFLLSIIPLLASLGLITLAVKQQEKHLAARERALFESAYMTARQAELRQYVQLAQSIIAPLYNSVRDDEAIRQEAIRLLASLDYGLDGYFFIYEMNGKNVMHARQPELVGRDMSEMRDLNGTPVIQQLIARAREGGGFVRYAWEKPSSQTIAPKLGYAVALPRWNWMLGTGLYLDDIQTTLGQVDKQISDNVETTMLWIAAVALLGVALIGGSGLVLNLSDAREADVKLRLMARQVVKSQEDERAHLSRELHDSTSQTLVSIKLLVESAVAQLEHHQIVPPPALPKALGRLNDALVEVRHISHRLRPAALDVLGLPEALEHLGREFNVHGRLAFAMRVRGDRLHLPDEINTVLFRITQEALTNIDKHARHASRVQLWLIYHVRGVRLGVRDNGAGFDVDDVSKDPRRGIGLRNMRERLASIGGTFDIFSRRGETRIVADVPLSAIARFSRSQPPTAT
ncbi:MAG: cache domain-containing protein [Pseudomonadota bacterium]